MSEIRRIAVVSSSRADFSHLTWPLRAMADHPRLAPELLLFGAHLSPEFGRTGDLTTIPGVPIRARVESLLSSDTDVGMAKTIGLATLGLADALATDRPDLMLVIADRYEMLAAASVAVALRIPIAHVEGGEVSMGAIDDAIRNALTKLAHLHFVPHETAARRVRAMGEESWRVHVTGAPSLDHVRETRLPDGRELRQRLGLAAEGRLIVAAIHPLTLAADTLTEADAYFDALGQLEGQVVFCFPNADAGSRALIERAREYCDGRSDAVLCVNLPAVDYLGLLAAADLMLGNSSSGIMESATFRLPTLDVGDRQAGRLHPANVIAVPAEAGAIIEAARRALSTEFRDQLESLTNPYGDGTAGRRIAELLAEAPGRDRLLHKRPVPLS